MRRGAVICILVFLLAVRPALAACTSPAASETQLIYNKDYHTYQFCNGTNWMTAGQVVTPTLTFGETNVLSNGDSGNANLLLAQSATLSFAGTIQSLSFLVNNAAGNLRLGIYDATGPSGGPGARLAQTNSFAPTAGWNTANVVTPVALAAGTYWLAYVPNNNGLGFVNDNGVSGGCFYQAFTFGSMPATFSTTPSNCGPGHWSFYATITSPACSNPTGVEGNIFYNKDYHTLQYCNGTTWYPLGTGSGGGSGNCSSPTGSPGQFIYNQDYHTWQYCNGTNWVKFSGGSSMPLPTSSDGYFVMSKTTWKGNLGGSLAAADAKCLTDLTTNTGWRGYPDANSRGILTSGHVHALLCSDQGGQTCNEPSANTTYFFADANNVNHGGANFTTDGTGLGPNDSADWGASDHFGAYYTYWMDRGFSGTNYDTQWGSGNNSPNNDCGSSAADTWSHATNGYSAYVAYTSFVEPNGDNVGSVSRWWDWNGHASNGTATCDQQLNLICYVNP